MTSRSAFQTAGVVLIAVVGLWLQFPSASQAPAAGLPEILAGIVSDAKGAVMEGVAVSARSTAPGTFATTTVFSNRSGRYAFPPLAPGSYELLAQAVGFHAGKATKSLARGSSAQNFTLQPIADTSSPAFTNQLNGAEWMAALPEATPADRRMKEIFRSNCTSCHMTNFVLQNRFDEAGWLAILSFMERTSAGMSLPRMDRPPLPILNYHKADLAAYLAKVRGPGESPLRPRPLPRPTGEATQVVVSD
jgi:hypothetical protein